MTDDPVEHALAYPFAPPDGSYVLDGDAVRRVEDLPDLRGRHAVLACGSNQSPDQVRRKFSGFRLGAVYVLEAWIDGLDAAYSAHVARYGSIPATPVRAPGVRTRLFVTWLTDDQLVRMHESEAVGKNYSYGRIEGLSVRHHGETMDATVHAYVSNWGCLTVDGAPVALAEISARGRTGPVLAQRDVQDLARRRLGSDVDLRAFIADAAADEAVRRARSRALNGDAAFDPDGYVITENGGKAR